MTFRLCKRKKLNILIHFWLPTWTMNRNLVTIIECWEIFAQKKVNEQPKKLKKICNIAKFGTKRKGWYNGIFYMNVSGFERFPKDLYLYSFQYFTIHMTNLIICFASDYWFCRWVSSGNMLLFLPLFFPFTSECMPSLQVQQSK